MKVKLDMKLALTYWSLTVGGNPLSLLIPKLLLYHFFWFLLNSNNRFSQLDVKYIISKAPFCQSDTSTHLPTYCAWYNCLFIIVFLLYVCCRKEDENISKETDLRDF